MAEIVVNVKADGESVICDPEPTVLQHGDTLQWESAQGEVAIAFDPKDSPVTPSHSTARQGQRTKPAHVEKKAEFRTYACDVTLRRANGLAKGKSIIVIEPVDR
jgi:hypothetical protein